MSKKSKVTQHLWTAMESFLHASDFRRVSGVNSYRDHAKTIDVLQIEFFDGPTHRVWGSTTHSFGISCGVFLRFSPNPFGGHVPVDAAGNLQPDASVCALRSHLWCTRPQPKGVPKNVWFVEEDLSNLDIVADDVLTRIRSAALPWFERFGSTAKMLDVLQNAEEDMDSAAPCFGFGRKGSPVRNLYLGFTAVAEERRQLARDALNEAVNKGGFSRLSGSDDVDNEIKKVISGL